MQKNIGCVFKLSFPDRRCKSGQKVSTYGGLIQYLREKDRRIRLAELPFEGRNIVLYMRSYDYNDHNDISSISNNNSAKKKMLWCDNGWFCAPSPSPVPTKNDVIMDGIENEDNKNHGSEDD